MKAQITLTVAAAKETIAAAVVRRPDFQAARQQGKIVLKGGTTVSAVARCLGLPDLRISGRISPRGTKASGSLDRSMAHSILYEAGAASNIDDCFAETIASLGADDVVVIGANALDSQGQAGLLLGSLLGGVPGQGMIGMMAQGCKVLIVCGLEKLISGTIIAACQAAGIMSADWSMGMSCGLVPLVGEVITEQTALATLFSLTVTPIAAGGICGAEGATTFILDGREEDLRQAVNFILPLLEKVDNTSQNIVECHKGSPGCARHKNCAWRDGKGGKLLWREK